MDVKTNHSLPMRKKIGKFIRDSSWTRDLLSIALLLIFVGSASAATITVTSNNDSGSGSLRQAIIDAASGDTIDFDSSLNGQTISLTTGELLINKNLAITGPGPNLLAINAGLPSRVFDIGLGFDVTISGLSIGNGLTAFDGGGIFNNGSLTVANCTVGGNSASGSGGGIYVNVAGSLRILNSTLGDNSALQSGGGIFNGGFLQVRNSTLVGNSAGVGGGIHNAGSVLTITNSTLSGNSAASSGGAIFDTGPQTIIANSTLSGNLANNGGGIWTSGGTGVTVELGNTILKTGTQGANIAGNGVVVSHGYNLSNDDAAGLLTAAGDRINTDPQLNFLADSGGPTLTHALLPGSPAINAGDPNFNPNDFDPPMLYDQRGPVFVRVAGNAIDIGAFEFQTGPTPTPTPAATAAATATPTPTPTTTPMPTATPTSTPAVNEADLLLSLGVDNLNPRQGDLITYTITVQNFGPSDAVNVVMNNILSSGTAFHSAHANRGHLTAPQEGQTGTVTWYLGDLLNSGQESAQISVTVIVRGRTTITNTASVTSNIADPNIGNNTAAITISVVPGGGHNRH
jgi:uncharacterized repeat protein (TIGR01451 family)